MVPTIWYFYLCVNGSDKCQPQIEIVCWVEDKRSVAHFVQWCAQLDTRSKRTLNGKIKGKIIESYFSCSILQIWRCPYLNKNNKIKIWFIERDGRQAIPLRREQQIIIKNGHNSTCCNIDTEMTMSVIKSDIYFLFWQKLHHKIL